MEAGNPKGNGGSLGHVLLNQEVSGSTTKGYMGLPYEQIKLPISRRQFMYIYFISFSQLAYLFWGCLFEHINQHAWGGFWVARTKAGILFSAQLVPCGFPHGLRWKIMDIQCPKPSNVKGS